VGGLQEGSVSDCEGMVGVTVDLWYCMEMVKTLDLLSVTVWLRGLSERRQWWLVIVIGHWTLTFFLTPAFDHNALSSGHNMSLGHGG
jgi:hypothetical protein